MPLKRLIPLGLVSLLIGCGGPKVARCLIDPPKQGFVCVEDKKGFILEYTKTENYICRYLDDSRRQMERCLRKEPMGLVTTCSSDPINSGLQCLTFDEKDFFINYEDQESSELICLSPDDDLKVLEYCKRLRRKRK